MSTIDDYTKKFNTWFDSLSENQKYSLLAMIIGFVLLLLAIILW